MRRRPWIFPAIFGLTVIVAACDGDEQEGDPVTNIEIPTGPVAGIDQSDDYDRFGPAFEAAGRSLIGDGRCVEADFLEWGGFIRSVNRPGEGLYFTYCTLGTQRIVTLNDRIYVAPNESGTFAVVD